MSVCPENRKIIKILIIDDDIESTKLLELVMQSFGFDVVTSITGMNGLKKASTEQPNIIILDVRIPDLNGWQICKRLKKNPLTETIPIIFYTAYSQINDVEKSERLGAELFLNKPLDPEILVQKIRKIFDKYNNN
ncbi:MAG: response regulator [Chitinispirillia bacterium]|jgi:DNA-binding response OmpR family regulator